MIILTYLIFLNSCTKDIDSYQFTISNEYFEPLYKAKIGDAFFDTILINEITPVAVINEGSYEFTTHTASRLILKSDVIFRGDRQNIKLIVNKNGKLMSE